ncbi:restriction endonuclease [Streptomyces sp. NPDC005930]|uniref:restriction endonuclease n=1 Tax=Streptomyces sp. NPDC005930 TaxID=3364736 RepID=UPI003690E56C
MDARDFEEYVAELCRRDDCTEVERVDGSGDLGAERDWLPARRQEDRRAMQAVRQAPLGGWPAATGPHGRDGNHGDARFGVVSRR